jgi:hypothetical protein
MSTWHPPRGRFRRQENGHHKRSRGGSAPHGEGAAFPSEGQIVLKSAPTLPGFVWDEGKQRYFRSNLTHSQFQAFAAGPKLSTTASEDALPLQAPCIQLAPGRATSFSSSILSACAYPHICGSLQLQPILRECTGRAPIQTGSFHWSLAKRQTVQGCKHAAYFSRSVVLFSDQSVSLLHLPASMSPRGEEARAPVNQVLQLPSNPLSSSALNVTAAFHSSDKYSWLNYGTCMHVAVAAPHGQQSGSAAVITIMNCQSDSCGMVPVSVHSNFLIGGRHPCAWLGRGSSHPTLDWEKPICYVAGGRGGQHVAALEFDQTMGSRTAQEWRMPNGMAVSCMSLWAGSGVNCSCLMFCGGNSSDAVSIDPRSSRTLVHPGIRHVTQCGWPGGYQMVCGHVGGSICVWDMRFTKNAISTTAPQKEVFSLWSLSVSHNAALALFTKNDSATLLDLSSFHVQKFDTQIAADREGTMEVLSRIGSHGEGCAVFDNSFLAWDANQAWAWQARVR